MAVCRKTVGTQTVGMVAKTSHQNKRRRKMKNRRTDEQNNGVVSLGKKSKYKT